MMKMKGTRLQLDERNAGTIRKICTVLYLATVAVLWIDVCWRQLFLNQPLSEFIDLAILMAANVIVFIGAILYYGGITVPRIRASLVAALYGACIVAGTAFTIYKYRLSSIGEILWKVLLVAAISGFVVLLYAIAAYLSTRKADREIEE